MDDKDNDDNGEHCWERDLIRNSGNFSEIFHSLRKNSEIWYIALSTHRSHQRYYQICINISKILDFD